ncbi:single-stranded-DNA-specific exonuclease RecJ [Pectinatus haikarae]|uniref:single-stranded-DNA-specific exonuclease RecJ n=1 Tax=Pectinatus haikarae TaxID=349096 RepID=UPI0018C8370E|nr:single-stranded-DNA-specific exonuclease RecJ [Pectinatus haikarae]
MKKKWNISPADAAGQRLWAEKLNISPAAAGVLLKRGWTLQNAQAFLNVQEQNFYDPFLLPNMQAAVARIKAAIFKKDLITIFGDYDVDGITATAVLYKTLKELGALVEYYLPDRQSEGYGVHKQSIDKFIGQTNLLITVDCGIRSTEEMEYAGNYMDVIVTDHHLPGPQLPAAVAVIDPKRDDSCYPDENLAGVGVAFKLCQALWQNVKNEEFTKYLDIVALGTVADIVPLLNENRKIVKSGLTAIENTGLIELIKLCGLKKENITAGHIGFVLGPRLNAAGRLKHAGIGVELLLTEDREKASELAKYLDDENKIRQSLVESTFAEAVKTVHANNYDKTTAIVAAGQNWHPGIIGIVASRLVEEFYRPTVVISLNEEAIGKGSCRSIRGFNICDALSASDDVLESFGGHAMAAGLTINKTKVELFRKKFTQYADDFLTEENLQPLLEIAEVLHPEEVTKKLITDIAQLEPFGVGNPAPLFLCGGVQAKNPKRLGKNGEHLKFVFSVKDRLYTALGWGFGEFADKLANKNAIFVFHPEINIWNGKEQIQFNIKDIKMDERKYPSHDEIGLFYIFLKKTLSAGKTARLDTDTIRKAYTHFSAKAITAEEIEYCLQVLSEINIINFNKTDHSIELLPLPKEKKNINTSKTFLQQYI